MNKGRLLQLRAPKRPFRYPPQQGVPLARLPLKSEQAERLIPDVNAESLQLQSGSVENGLLRIEFRREIPEALKPRRIEVARVKANDRIKMSQGYHEAA